MFIEFEWLIAQVFFYIYATDWQMDRSDYVLNLTSHMVPYRVIMHRWNSFQQKSSAKLETAW